MSKFNFKFLNDSPFNKKLEVINLVLPILFIILTFIVPESNKLSATANFSIYLLSEFIFLNSIHVFFTITMLFFVPEFKKYIVDKSKSMGCSVLNNWLRYFFLVTLFFSLLRYLSHMEGNSQITLQFISFMALVVSMYATYHSLMQTVGLSLNQYSSVLKNNNSETIKNIIKHERMLSPLLMIFTIILLIAAKLGSELTKGLLFFSLCAVLFFYISWILLKVYALDAQLFKLKILFHSRYFLFIFAFLNSFTIAARAAVHGFEYFMVTKKIMSNTKISYTKKSFLVYVSLASVFAFVMLYFIYVKFNHIFFNNTAVVKYTFLDDFCYVFSMSLSLTHFYIDSFIYKMSDPIVQKNQAVFFKNEPELA